MNIKTPACYDISHWKLVPDFKTIFPVPLLMITKATEGINYIDQTFVKYMLGMKEAGYKRGCYHFNRKAYKGADQARHFLSVVDGYVDVETLLILDVEEGGETASQLWSWLETVRAKYTHNRLILYSRRNILEQIPMTTAEKEYFRRIMVWTAGYPANPDLFSTVPGAYTPDPTRFGPVVLWQYTDAGQVAGISGDVDCNWIDPVFAKILQGQPPQEETMSQWYQVTADTLNIRTGPGLSYPDVGDLKKGDRIETVRNVGGWLETYKILRVSGSIETPIPSVYCKDSYVTAIAAPVTPAVVKTPFTLTVQGFKPYSGELEKA